MCLYLPRIVPGWRYNNTNYPAQATSIPMSIKTLAGKVITLDVEPSATIQAAKQLVHEKEGFPVVQSV